MTMEKVPMKRILLPLTLLVLTACAKPPEEIAAAAKPSTPYLGKSCTELAAMEAKGQRDLADIEARQRATVQDDRDAMWAVHIPVGSLLGGDREQEVASAKGDMQAISAARQSQRC